MSRKAEYKPLLFTTTLRNPERIKRLLWVLKEFNGKVLTENLATKIVGELIKYGLYRPTIQIPNSVKEKWGKNPKGEFGEYLLSDEEVQHIISCNPQNHKEAGFSKGYPSRFATIFDFTKELGFVYFSPNTPVEFSELGNRYASIINVTTEEGGKINVKEEHPEYEIEAFLQAMSKYQRKNPFVRVLNDNVPLILLLETIKLLNADTSFKSTGISRHELPLLIFWKDNDAHALYSRIKKIRKEYGFNPSDEVICDICTEEIMGGFKKFEPRSIIFEYPDEFIRKMRLTGLISLRGGGRFVDINHNEDAKVEYVLQRYSTYESYTDERAYFDYMATIDEDLFGIKTETTSIEQSQEHLIAWLKEYSWNSIKKELSILGGQKNSKNELLRLIPKSARLEFLIALAIKSQFPKVIVRPNYPTDDEGIPTSTAGGNKGDIECEENKKGILVEVTMSGGRTQTMMEIWPIERHLKAYQHFFKEAQCIFVAPSIFSDSYMQIQFLKTCNASIIRPFKITDFIWYLETSDTLYEQQ